MTVLRGVVRARRGEVAAWLWRHLTIVHSRRPCKHAAATAAALDVVENGWTRLDQVPEDAKVPDVARIRARLTGIPAVGSCCSVIHIS